MQVFLIPQTVFDTLVRHARTEAPFECCGLLVGPVDGSEFTVTEAIPLVNEAASPIAYRSEPRSMLQAQKRIREANQRIIALYHSHPTSEAIPSRVDVAEWYWADALCAIIGLASEPPELRLWRIEGSMFQEVKWVEVG